MADVSTNNVPPETPASQLYHSSRVQQTTVGQTAHPPLLERRLKAASDTSKKVIGVMAKVFCDAFFPPLPPTSSYKRPTENPFEPLAKADELLEDTLTKKFVSFMRVLT